MPRCEKRGYQKPRNEIPTAERIELTNGRRRSEDCGYTVMLRQGTAAARNFRFTCPYAQSW